MMSIWNGSNNISNRITLIEIEKQTSYLLYDFISPPHHLLGGIFPREIRIVCVE